MREGGGALRVWTTRCPPGLARYEMGPQGSAIEVYEGHRNRSSGVFVAAERFTT